MSTTTILASLLHHIENFLAYLFTPLNTYLSSSAQQFLIISSACFTAIIISSFLNKTVNTFGALLTRIPICPETILTQAIGELEAIPTSTETLLGQAILKFESIRNYKNVRNHENIRDYKMGFKNTKACWKPTAKQTKHMLGALYGIFLACYFAYVVMEFEGWVRKGIIVLSGLSLVNVRVLSLLGGARGGDLVMSGIPLGLLLIGRGLLY